MTPTEQAHLATDPTAAGDSPGPGLHPPLSLEARYRVRFDEATPGGTVRTGALLGYLQDIAWLHSSALGFTRAWYHDRGLAWVVRGVEIEVREPIRDGDEITLTTRIAGYRRVMARRASVLRNADGRQVGHAVVDWAMTDGATVVRVPAEFTTIPGIDLASFAPIRPGTAAPPATARVISLVPRLRELDPMGHANNGAYADWLDEAVADAGGASLVGRSNRRHRIEYLRPAGPGAALESISWAAGDGFAWYLRDGSTGEPLARGMLEPAPTTSGTATEALR